MATVTEAAQDPKPDERSKSNPASYKFDWNSVHRGMSFSVAEMEEILGMPADDPVFWQWELAFGNLVISAFRKKMDRIVVFKQETRFIIPTHAQQSVYADKRLIESGITKVRKGLKALMSVDQTKLNSWERKQHYARLVADTWIVAGLEKGISESREALSQGWKPKQVRSSDVYLKKRGIVDKPRK